MIENIDTALSLNFTPIIPVLWIAIASVASAALLVLASWKHQQGVICRSIAVALFILTLLNPSITEEEREQVNDVVGVVIDESQSQKTGNRSAQSKDALKQIIKELKKQQNLEIRTIKPSISDNISSETKLFNALDNALSDVPQKRRSGVIFITDGQVNDIPTVAKNMHKYGPIHVLLSGQKDEKDRQLIITKAPAYGVVGQKTSIQYKIEDTGFKARELTSVTLKQGNAPPKVFFVPIGEIQTLEVEIQHGGQNIFELSVQEAKEELTKANNKAPIIINGVRDRLRVLLVSGKPHAGGRMWRDLLTSDPSVELVHFTILRGITKIDATPSNELALIAFPFKELFEVKLNDFDLIILDRYHLDNILPSHYFLNIANYVENGGALLEASGPSFAGARSLYNTALHKVLPGAPTGQIIQEPFYPTITENGYKHPVTTGLHWEASGKKTASEWGKWLRLVALNAKDSDVLMSGAKNNPLLILNRTKKGRVAQLASDNIWLWSRGYDGGGPHTELLRRTIHWLMKEPELDETALRVHVKNDQISIRSSEYTSQSMDIRMTTPDGKESIITLEPSPDGWLTQNITADKIGVYRFQSDNGSTNFAIIGDVNSPELRELHATPDKFSAIVKKTNGSIRWLDENGAPSVRMLGRNQNYSGGNWIGLKQNNDYIVSGIKSRALFPPWFIAFLLIGAAILTWLREGRT